MSLSTTNLLWGPYTAWMGAIGKKHHTQVHQKIKQQISNNHIAIFSGGTGVLYGKMYYIGHPMFYAKLMFYVSII